MVEGKQKKNTTM